MTENELIQQYKSNPSPKTITNLLKYYQSVDNHELYNEYILDYYESYSLSEDMWIDWFKESLSNKEVLSQLIDLAIEDLPYSSKIHMFRIENSTNKVKDIESSLSMIGEFDNDLWDEYRKVIGDDKIIESYQKQLSLPVPDYDEIYGAYILDLKAMADGDERERLENWKAPKETLEMVNMLSLMKWDFKNVRNVLEIVRKFKKESYLERAIVYNPYNAQLWFEYLKLFPSEKLAARAVRFCPKSGIIWASRCQIIKKSDTLGFSFIDNLTDAQILLGKLISMRPNDNNIDFIKEILKDSKVFNIGDHWVWPTILIYEQMKLNKCSKEEIRNFLKESIDKNPQIYELWMKLIDYNIEIKDYDEARNTYYSASKSLLINLPQLIQKWILFESLHGSDNYINVMERINEVLSNVKENQSISGDFEKRTIFVANIIKINGIEDELQQLFSEIGEVEAVRLKPGHKDTLYGFIQFRKEEDAKLSIEKFNGFVFHGLKLSIKPHETKQKLTLFIHYASNAKPDELIKFLKESTKITDFKLRLANENKQNQEKGYRTKGWGFIDLKSTEDAMKFMALSGKIFQTQALKIEIANKTNKEVHIDKKKQDNPPKVENTEKEETHRKSLMNDDELKEFFGL